MKRIFSGIQPTGTGVPHLGNYLGAMKYFPSSMGRNKTDALFCAVDLHATTLPYDPIQLRLGTLMTAAGLIAVGVDPDKAIVFKQSSVQEHAYLGLILGHLSKLGELERMTQFKEKGRGDSRESIPTGLLTYPLLMAADILLYKTTHVPVGKDQHQHLQLAADLASRFNHVYGKNVFPIPQAVGISGEHARVMSLRDPLKKMSKSDPLGAVFLTDTIDEANKKFKRAVSETETLPHNEEELIKRAPAHSLVTLLSGMTNESVNGILVRLGGCGYAPLKRELSQAFEDFIYPIGKRMQELMKDQSYLNQVLQNGAVSATEIAQKTIIDVKDVAGF